MTAIRGWIVCLKAIGVIIMVVVISCLSLCLLFRSVSFRCCLFHSFILFFYRILFIFLMLIHVTVFYLLGWPFK